MEMAIPMAASGLKICSIYGLRAENLLAMYVPMKIGMIMIVMNSMMLIIGTLRESEVVASQEVTDSPTRLLPTEDTVLSLSSRPWRSLVRGSNCFLLAVAGREGLVGKEEKLGT